MAEETVYISKSDCSDPGRFDAPVQPETFSEHRFLMMGSPKIIATIVLKRNIVFTIQ